MELWDLYDENRIPLGRTHPRGEPVPEGTYHLAVIVVILNPRGEVLLTRRAQGEGRVPRLVGEHRRGGPGGGDLPPGPSCGSCGRRRALPPTPRS